MKFFGKELKFNNNKVYHAGDKPTPSEIGAAATSHGTHVTWATTAPKANGTATVGTVDRVAREDHIHPLQTTVSGNAGTATKLQTARTITLKGNANGSVSFDGSGNVTISTHPRIFAGPGTSGTSGYVAFAQLVVTAAYANRPIEFKLISRGRATAGTVSLMFASVNGTDPALSSLRYWGTDYGVFAHKTGTSTWLLYCTKSEAYDEITLVGHDYGSQGVTVTYPGSFITTKPTSNVTNASLGGTFGHANTASSATSATKATQDSAGQQINTTYIKGLSVSGRTITYTKGDGSTGTITTQDTDTNTTYSAGTGLSLSGTTFNHKNSVTAGTAQGDASKTLSWGGTFTIPTVTYDAQGHITGKGTTTMTMPANPNSDTKVTNTLNTTAKAYITGTTSASTNTGTQVFDTGVYLDTTAGMLTATTFKGALNGNASTATKLATTRTIKIGNTSRTFDGTGDITWTAADIGVASINDSTTATGSVWSSNKTQTQINTSYNTMTKRVEALEETIYSDFVSKSGDTMSGDLTIKKPDGGASKIKVYRTLNSKEMEGSMDVYNGNGGSVSLSTWDRTTGTQTSSYVFGGDALWAPDTPSGTRPTLGTASFRFGAFYGPGMIALATGSIYLGGLVSPASQTCDYLRIGSNLMASDSSKTIHFIDSAGAAAKINVASVETNGAMTLNIKKASTYYSYDVHRYCSSNTTSGYTHSTARFGCTDNEGGAATLEIRVNDTTKSFFRLYQSGAVGIGGKKFSIASSAPSGAATGDVWVQI